MSTRGGEFILFALIIGLHPILSSGRQWTNVLADGGQINAGRDRYRYRESREIGWPFALTPATAAPTQEPVPSRRPTARPTSVRVVAATPTPVPPATRGPTTRTPTVPKSAPTTTPTTTDTANECPVGYYPYLIDMYDRWGDGWEGTDIVIKEQFAYEEKFRGTLSSGHFGAETVCLSNMECYEVSVEGWSTWDAEIYWEIFASLAFGDGGGAERVRVAYGENLGTRCTFDPKGGSSGSMAGCPNTCREEFSGGQPSPTPPGGLMPTKPTKRPTSIPTPVPLENRPPGYYNYNLFDSDFGPDAWGRIDTSGSLWESDYDNIDSSNQCNVQNSRMQSPIVLDEEGGTMPCQARRQIRTTSRQFSPCDGGSTGTFQITPTRLRIVFATGSEPTVLIPEGGNALEAAYLEVAVPSLHRRVVDGESKRYDAEYTIVSPWNDEGKIVLVSVLIDASGETSNAMFQTLLNEWSSVETCSHPFKFGGGRLLAQNEVEKERNGREKDGTDDTISRQGGISKGRGLQCDFDIFDRSLVPSIYYQSYYGSLPEPPCNGNANWFVISKPMTISALQHSQMKTLLINGPCRGDPYAKDLGGRNRPIQPNNGRAMEQCGMKSFWLDCNDNCNCEKELCLSDFL